MYDHHVEHDQNQPLGAVRRHYCSRVINVVQYTSTQFVLESAVT